MQTKKRKISKATVRAAFKKFVRYYNGRFDTKPERDKAEKTILAWAREDYDDGWTPDFVVTVDGETYSVEIGGVVGRLSRLRTPIVVMIRRLINWAVTAVSVSSNNMNKRAFLLLSCLLVGCSGTTYRIEGGAGRPVAIGSLLDDAGGVPSTVFHGGFYFGGDIADTLEGFTLDAFVGPAVESANGDTGAGFDVLPRFRYTRWILVEPYIGLSAGFHYFPNGIGEQSTDWGFVLGGGPGVRVRMSEKTWLTAEYRAWHESNGSKVFGSPEPNPGFNSDLIILGLEFKF